MSSAISSDEERTGIDYYDGWQAGKKEERENLLATLNKLWEKHQDYAFKRAADELTRYFMG